MPQNKSQIEIPKQRNLCPNCEQGKKRLMEYNDGYKLCGLCKGLGWVFSTDESYTTKHTNIFNVVSGLDVVRIRAIEQKSNIAREIKNAKKIGSKFLGYFPYYKTLIQNDIN